MNNYLELKYINLLGFRLRNFTQKGHIYNYSCPICGDSQKNERKARGYLLDNRGTGYYAFCHNCNISLSLSNFLKEVANDLYEQYRLERLKDTKMDTSLLERTVFEKPKFLQYNALKALRTVSQLPVGHPVKKFVEDRKIPTTYHWRLYAAPRFMTWVNEHVIPGKFDDKALKFDAPRLVIPIFDKEKKCHAFHARAVKSDGAKYIKISLNKDEYMLYGRDTVDVNRTIYVMEGPIDSMFIPNSVAVGSANLPVAATLLPKDKLVLIFDNEPRNKEVIQVMRKAIHTGFKVTIFPDSFKHKDINEAILAGMQPSDIKKVIDDYSFRGLSAVLALKNWEKI